MIALRATQVDDNTQFCGRAQLAPTFFAMIFRADMESAPTIRKAIAVKKTIEFTSNQGLRVRNIGLA